MGQDSTTHKKITFIIKTDIGQPIINAVFYKGNLAGSLSAEVCLKKRISLQLTGYYSEIKFKEYGHTAFQIITAYKYFLSKRTHHTGFYTGAYIKGTSLNEVVNRVDNGPVPIYLEYNTYSLGGGLIVGYQNYIMKRIVIDFIFGCGARQDLKIKVIRAENISLNQSGMKQMMLDGIFALNIGYKF